MEPRIVPLHPRLRKRTIGRAPRTGRSRYGGNTETQYRVLVVLRVLPAAVEKVRTKDWAIRRGDLSPTRPKDTRTLGSAFSCYGRHGLLGPLQAPRSRGDLPSGSRSRCGAAPSPSTTPKERSVDSASAAIGATASGSPLRLCDHLRLCVKTRCATEPARTVA